MSYHGCEETGENESVSESLVLAFSSWGLVDTPSRTDQLRDVEFHGKLYFPHDLGLFLNVGSPVKSDHVCRVARTSRQSNDEPPSWFSSSARGALTDGQVGGQSSDT